MPITGVVWLAVVAGITVVVGIVRVVRTRTSVRRFDIGAVSHQWVAAHRVESGNTLDR
jgi:hypothetical protein